MGAAIVIAGLLIVVGITHLLSAWRSDGARSTERRELVGILYFLAGLTICEQPLWGTMVLTVIVAAVLVTEGVIGVAAYFLVPAMCRDAMWTLLGSFIPIILGLLIWIQWRSSSVWMIGMLVGVNLLVVETSHVLKSFQARSHSMLTN